MSGAIGQTGYGLLTQLLAGTSTVQQQLNTLTEQASNGLIADTYAGLGNGAAIALDLQPQVATLQTQQRNIDAATSRLGVTQTAMTQLQSIVATFMADMNNLPGTAGSEVASTAAAARSALTQVANLLDTQDGNTYIFAGQDSQNPPVPNPDGILSSGFATQIASAVAGLTTNGAAATAASTLAIAGSNAAGTSPFSTYLSQPAASLQVPYIQVGPREIVQTGILASANTAVASTGSSTTGSYMRDLMRALATIGSLTPAQQNDPNFATLVQDTRTSLTGAVTAMADDVGVLGDTQSRLAGIQTGLSNTQTALTTQVGNVEDVDMAATLSHLTQTQTRLQASYQLIAGMAGLSLVKYL